MNYEDEVLVGKGKLHFQRHGENFIRLLDDGFENFIEAWIILLELVYQDGRIDALLELRGRIQDGCEKTGEGQHS